MSGWLIFTISMAIPGFAEIYSAWKLLFFIRVKGAIIPFLFCFLSGVFDLLFSGILTLVLIFGGKLVLDLDLSNIFVLLLTISLVIAFYGWRVASGLIALWFAGVIEETVIRRLTYIQAIP